MVCTNTQSYALKNKTNDVKNSQRSHNVSQVIILKYNYIWYQVFVCMRLINDIVVLETREYQILLYFINLYLVLAVCFLLSRKVVLTLLLIVNHWDFGILPITYLSWSLRLLINQVLHLSHTYFYFLCCQHITMI